MAVEVSTPLHCARPLSDYCDTEGNKLTLRLAGAHQEQNASLAVALAAAWEASPRGGCLLLPSNGSSASSKEDSGHVGDAGSRARAARERASAVEAGRLPEMYLEGLRTAVWPGRNQVQFSCCSRSMTLFGNKLLPWESQLSKNTI